MRASKIVIVSPCLCLTLYKEYHVIKSPRYSTKKNGNGGYWVLDDNHQEAYVLFEYLNVLEFKTKPRMIDYGFMSCSKHTWLITSKWQGLDGWQAFINHRNQYNDLE